MSVVCDFQTGSADMPTSKIIEKQKVVIDQLTQKLEMEDLQHLDQLRLELWPIADYSA